jgi:hypothetical protein
VKTGIIKEWAPARGTHGCVLVETLMGDEWASWHGNHTPEVGAVAELRLVPDRLDEARECWEVRATPEQMAARRAFYAKVREHNDEPSDAAVNAMAAEVGRASMAPGGVVINVYPGGFITTGDLQRSVVRALALEHMKEWARREWMLDPRPAITLALFHAGLR